MINKFRKCLPCPGFLLLVFCVCICVGNKGVAVYAGERPGETGKEQSMEVTAYVCSEEEEKDGPKSFPSSDDEKTDRPHPKTGDTSVLKEYLLLLIGGCLVIIVCLDSRSRRIP